MNPFEVNRKNSRQKHARVRQQRPPIPVHASVLPDRIHLGRLGLPHVVSYQKIVYRKAAPQNVASNQEIQTRPWTERSSNRIDPNDLNLAYSFLKKIDQS